MAISAIHESDFILAATGDSIINRRISLYDKLQPLVKMLRTADVVYTNFETVLHNYEFFPAPESGGTWLQSPPFVIDELKWAGFNLLSCANNHIMDYSYDGLLNTMQTLDDAGLVYAGVGKNLGAARAPKYIETKNGRIALISTCSTFYNWNRAGDARPDVAGRPGINPLRFYYVVDTGTFKELQRLFFKLNFWFECYGNQYEFLSPGPVYLPYRFEVSDKPGVQTVANQSDVEGNIRSIKEARRQADYVIVTLHTHEFDRELEIAATFVPPFARACIDVGADVFIGQGSHILRGIEIYQQKPIFYGLGNFIINLDTTTRLPSDFYERYGLGITATPFDAFEERTRQRKNLPLRQTSYHGLKGHQSVVALCTYNSGQLLTVKLYPIQLIRDSLRSLSGLPVLAESAAAHDILETLTRLSAPYATKIGYDEGVGMINLET